MDLLDVDWKINVTGATTYQKQASGSSVQLLITLKNSVDGSVKEEFLEMSVEKLYSLLQKVEETNVAMKL
ncbi:unnamed protein product [Notodromas monacha]|uniref:COMM domain-containing protein n=1 Tax=Notodromas monacha TaxID=399045 RepID=A0A7R9BF83_9CRUS|nr:unnamed protein product [Notodromas monacha]CAG0914307.1 unnamed protein product [Notodromas monacha]